MITALVDIHEVGNTETGQVMRSPAIAILVSVMIVFAMIFVFPLAINKGEKGMDLSKLVPESAGEWRIEGEDCLYDRETIFDYMDGAGEVYLSFAYQKLFVRRFTRPPDEELTVELYDMGNPPDAFGIFTRGRAGDDVGIGRDSEYRSGYLLFWKGKYFVIVYTLVENEESKETVFEISRIIADNITEDGAIPDMVSLLPEENLIQKSIRYFHKHTDLNQHYFLADDNILDLGMETEALIANYQEEDIYSFLLIIRYPEVGLARGAFDRFIDIYMPEGRESGIVQIEDGYWTTAASTGAFIIAVFDAPSARRAGQLLAAAKEHIEGADR